jgi:serine-type D-Ala-D-Ala carboxypeptidase/endopeptidase
MRRLLLLAIFATPAQAGNWKAVVERPVNAVINDKKDATVIVGVLDKEKEQIIAFGECDGRVPDRDSVFEIGSVTKVFTGLLLADCANAGVVKLDDPVQIHLPKDWKVPQRDDRDISLLHLATHTSGLPPQAEGFAPFVIADRQHPYAKYDVPALKKGLATTKLEYPIGSRHKYSNVGVGLLGHALSHASKSRSYDAILTERVLKPLGMDDTGVALSESRRKRLVPGHTAGGKRQDPWDFACIEACGALRSTVADLLKFVKSNADPRGPLKDALVMTHQPWRVIAPDEEEIGLCWFRLLTKKDSPKVWHNGQTGECHSFIGFVPGRGGVAVLCNVASMKVDDVGFAVLEQLAEAK